MTSYHAKALKDALGRLAGSPFLAAAIDHVSRNAGIIAAQLREAVLAEIPAYSESRNPDILPELARHGGHHIEEVLRLLRHGAVGNFEFVREHARRQAEQHFPLEAVLHAYRVGHKVFWHSLRDSSLQVASSEDDSRQAVSAIADFAIEYTDAVGTIAASTYAAHSRLLAESASDQRAQLLGILLEGHDEADARVARILRDAGYLDAQQSYCVGLARSVDPTEMLNPARARRLADSLIEIVQGTYVRHVIDLRDNRVVMVFCDRRRESGWTAPRTSLAKRLCSALNLAGNAVLIGLSNDAPSTAHIPAAHREAGVALELASVSERVVQFSQLPLQRLLLHFAGNDFRRVLPVWSQAFFAADAQARGVLSTTLRAYADCDMNVLQTAQALGLHPNSIYARMQRIGGVTGLQPTCFRDLSELLVVADCRM